jgi:CheY-like chemotaxis protein
VLIVDDTPNVADSLALLLETLGAKTRVAYSGAQGLAACAEFEPQFIFLDLGMPEMDDFETARRVRELPAGRRVIVIALTGWGGQEIKQEVEKTGFDRHLVKPVNIEEVETLLFSPSAEPGASVSFKSV